MKTIYNIYEGIFDKNNKSKVGDNLCNYELYKQAMEFIQHTPLHIGEIVYIMEELATSNREIDAIINDAVNWDKVNFLLKGWYKGDIIPTAKYLFDIAKTCFTNGGHWTDCFFTVWDEKIDEDLLNKIGKVETWQKGLTKQQSDVFLSEFSLDVKHLKNLKEWYFGSNMTEEIQIYGIPKYLNHYQETFIKELVKKRKV